MNVRSIQRMFGLVAFVAVVILTKAGPAKALHADVSGQTVIYAGASVWNGSDFERKDVAVRDGVFIDAGQVEGDFRIIDVSGKYITPPYANAHHHITNANDETGWEFLKDGVFYVWNPNLISTAWNTSDADYYARKDTYDVKTSMGGVTEPGGHPEKLYVKTLAKYVYRGFTYDDFYQAAFHYGRNEAEIEATLDLLVSQGAQFIKAMLLWSEEYDLRRDNDTYYGLKGLSPNNFSYLVKAAHKRNLTVFAHIQTRYDAIIAVAAGADMLGHLPAYSPPMNEQEFEQIALTEADTITIAAANVPSVPTYVISAYHYQYTEKEGNLNKPWMDRHYMIQAENLRKLATAGATILTGTDGPAAIYDEVNHWVDIGGLTASQALTSVYKTSRYLFPNRKIGKIEPGFEADFLVMSKSPADDINHLSAIEMRIKGGQLIKAPKEAVIAE